MPQANILAELDTALAFAGGIIADAHLADQANQFITPENVRSFMTEAAVLKIFVAWEGYLEQSFLEYLMGSPSTKGAALTCFLSVPSVDHAKQVLIGTQRYVDWSNPDTVLRLANLYLDRGEPYRSVISSIKTDLFDLKTIRNAAAHLSTSTSDQLDKLVLRKLGLASAGVTVYSLVTAADPSAPGKTVLQAYVEKLLAAATLISEG